MSITIIQPGLLTTIQDCGRYGYQKDGIIVSGAMDRLALRLGNILVGNDEKEAGIEITQMGPHILFQESKVIAITGANLSPAIDQIPVPMWRPVFVNKGSLLEFGKPQAGYRAYMTFAGGLAVPEVLGSYSTYLRAKIGGWYGRTLQKGDIIPYKRLGSRFFFNKELNKNRQPFVSAKWTLSQALLPVYEGNSKICVIKGPEYDLFTEDSQSHFWQTNYILTYQSDRMGYRLKGGILSLKVPEEIISSAATFGTVQVPANGNPIILMADHQTTGGYPRIGQVASVDFSRLAQVPPGRSISFKEISLQEAQQLYIAQERNIQSVKRALKLMNDKNLLQ